MLWTSRSQWIVAPGNKLWWAKLGPSFWHHRWCIPHDDATETQTHTPQNNEHVRLFGVLGSIFIIISMCSFRRVSKWFWAILLFPILIWAHMEPYGLISNQILWFSSDFHRGVCMRRGKVFECTFSFDLLYMSSVKLSPNDCQCYWNWVLSLF